MPLALVIDESDVRTLQDQVFDQVRSLILSSRLKSGYPMPGSRLLAEHLGVSRNTVTIAYEKLLSEGYLEIRPNVGTFVARNLPESLPEQPGVLRLAYSSDRAPGQDSLLDRIAASVFPTQAVEHPSVARLSVDFWPGRVNQRSFPLTEWRRIVDGKLRHGLHNQVRYGNPQGDEKLRRAIADHLGPARGVACTADDVVVVSGSQDGLTLIAQAIGQHATAFLHENPCYQGARFLFSRMGFACHPVPVDKDGLIVESLPEIRNAVLYVTPSHQFPTGVTLSLARRLRLLEWAARTDSLIVEDDYDGDFRYEGGPLTALRGLDRGGRVLYLGTFSKSMGPGLRLGFIVGPEKSAPALVRWKQLLSNGTPWIIQAAMAEFLDSGAFQRHLRRIRAMYRQRRDVLIGAIEHHFPGSEIFGRRGGMHLAWRLPDTGCARRLQRLALAQGIGIYTVEDGGACLDANGDRHGDLLMMGYAAIEEDDIARAIAMLARLDKTGLTGEG